MFTVYHCVSRNLHSSDITTSQEPEPSFIHHQLSSYNSSRSLNIPYVSHTSIYIYIESPSVSILDENFSSDLWHNHESEEQIPALIQSIYHPSTFQSSSRILPLLQISYVFSARVSVTSIHPLNRRAPKISDLVDGRCRETWFEFAIPVWPGPRLDSFLSATFPLLVSIPVALSFSPLCGSVSCRPGRENPASGASATKSPPRRAILVIDVQSASRVGTARIGDLRVTPRHTWLEGHIPGSIGKRAGFSGGRTPLPEARKVLPVPTIGCLVFRYRCTRSLNENNDFQRMIDEIGADSFAVVARFRLDPRGASHVHLMSRILAHD